MEASSVPLGRSGFVALVDADRLDIPLTYHFRDGRTAVLTVAGLSWSAQKNRNCFYAVAPAAGSLVAMSRLVLEAPAGVLVDHRDNAATLDNRRVNLRFANHAQNAVNTTRGTGTTERAYRGVRRVGKRWAAQVSTLAFTGRRGRLMIGCHAEIADAARAYDAAARLIYGEFANLNFPDLPPVDLPAKILAKLPAPESAF